jgi:hypothetical protein
VISKLYYDKLDKNKELITHLVKGVSTDQARWKPIQDKWSILEVINHLLDEEKNDFRMRLDLTLHNPYQFWPGIDPEGWVSERKYNERELDQSLENFLQERKKSLKWLAALSSPNWANTHDHPKLGAISAGDLFAAWVAHDLLHTRQLVNLHISYIDAKASPFSTKYALP